MITSCFQTLPKLKRGDKVAILSPSFAAPAKWPHIHELGLKRLTDIFGLIPVEFPTTRKLGASGEERSADFIAAFSNPEIKAVISTLGGDDQVTYIKNLPKDVFRNNPKPFFGYSDNTHFCNHLWLCGVPSFYGGCLFVQYGMTPEIEPFTVKYLTNALFERGEFELERSPNYNDIGILWDDPKNVEIPRVYEANEAWSWDGVQASEGISWGGCVESIDELLRNEVEIPTKDQFNEIILIAETSEELPSAEYVHRVFRALGERGILGRVEGLLVGRPQAWNFEQQNSSYEKSKFRAGQQSIIQSTFRKYNPTAPIVQNLDFGHSNPQICLPYGRRIKIEPESKKIIAEF